MIRTKTVNWGKSKWPSLLGCSLGSLKTQRRGGLRTHRPRPKAQRRRPCRPRGPLTTPLALTPLALFFGFRHLFKKSIKIFWRLQGSRSWPHPDPQTLLYHSRQLKKLSGRVRAAQAPQLGGVGGERWGSEGEGGGSERRAAWAAGSRSRGAGFKK